MAYQTHTSEESSRLVVVDGLSNYRLNPTVGPVTGLAHSARPAPVPPAG
jgi:hypothetical protein